MPTPGRGIVSHGLQQDQGASRQKAESAHRPESETVQQRSGTGWLTGSDRTNPVASPAATPTPAPVAAINKSAAVMVLCYHRLEEQPRPKDTLAITPQEFEKEMQQLKDAGFSVIPMQDFLAWRRGDKDIPPKAASSPSTTVTCPATTRRGRS